MVFLVQTGASPLCFGFASLAHIVTFLGLGLIIIPGHKELKRGLERALRKQLGESE
jgi:hypothetical protein